MFYWYGQKDEGCSYKMAAKNYFFSIKDVGKKRQFSLVGSTKKHSFWPFLLENSIAKAAKKLDSFMVNRVHYKEYFKKKIIKIPWVELELQAFSCWKSKGTIRAHSPIYVRFYSWVSWLRSLFLFYSRSCCFISYRNKLDNLDISLFLIWHLETQGRIQDFSEGVAMF